jgi:hypothetical protein
LEEKKLEALVSWSGPQAIWLFPSGKSERLSGSASGTILCPFPGALLDGANGEESVRAALSNEFDETVTNQRLSVSPLVGPAFDLRAGARAQHFLV